MDKSLYDGASGGKPPFASLDEASAGRPVFATFEVASGGKLVLHKIVFFVYILYSQKFSRYYIGNSENTEVRLKQHNDGKTKSTKKFRPWVLVYQESFETRIEARKREVQIKSYKGGQVFKKLINRADTQAVNEDRL